MPVQATERKATVGDNLFAAMELRQERDEVLVKEAVTGQEAAFGILFERYEQRMFRIALRILRNWEDAEDAVQHAFERAFVHLTAFQGQSRFSTWLTRIAINEALLMLRRRRPGHMSLEGNTTEKGKNNVLQIADQAATPEECCDELELHGILGEAIGDLRPTLRSVVQLHELGELTSVETAEVLGLSNNTVKARAFRARRLLRRSLVARLSIKNDKAGGFLFAPPRTARGIARQARSFAGAA
jgi:RNA polymerase sigma-70 factor (ECF subfamily)